MSEPDDGWFEDEVPLGRGLIFELWRVKRRAGARPFAVLALTLLLSGLVLYKVAGKVPPKVARVVIAVSEGSLASGRERMPARELTQYVAGVLLPTDALIALVKEKDLFPLRAKQGDVWAVAELLDLVEITVFRNYFLYQYYDDDRRTARIELTVTHANGALAYDLARRLAHIILETEQNLEAIDAATLTDQSQAVFDHAAAELADKEKAVATRTQEVLALARDPATEAGQLALAQNQLQKLEAETQEARIQLGLMADNRQRDTNQAAAMAAGLGLQLEIVSERAPDAGDPGRNYRIAVIGLLLFGMLLPIAAIAIAVFDPRIHDTEDVARLGFTTLGHVPAFAGDRIGSLRARGIRRRRLASY